MLASIQKVIEVSKHPNADTLDVIKVLGWTLVSKTSEFSVGDLCVYIEIDTIVPETPVFEFLRDKSFRIRTAKIRGIVSQGIAFPINILPEGDYAIGQDVSEILGVIHYEKPIPVSLRGMMRGNLPFGISKTDEIRIESVPEIIDEIYGMDVYITQKLDGTSCTFANKNNDFHVCSRNNSFKEDAKNIYWLMAYKYDISSKIKDRNIAIQGEIVGEGIQKNPVGLKGNHFYMFNAIDLNNMKYFDYDDLVSLSKEFEIPMVPVEYVGKFNFNFDEIRNMSNGKYIIGQNKIKEGIVVRTIKERYSEVLKGRTSFKCVSPEYLLKKKE